MRAQLWMNSRLRRLTDDGAEQVGEDLIGGVDPGVPLPPIELKTVAMVSTCGPQRHLAHQIWPNITLRQAEDASQDPLLPVKGAEEVVMTPPGPGNCRPRPPIKPKWVPEGRKEALLGVELPPKSPPRLQMGT